MIKRTIILACLIAGMTGCAAEISSYEIAKATDGCKNHGGVYKLEKLGTALSNTLVTCQDGTKGRIEAG